MIPLRLSEAAEQLRVHPATLRRWIACGCPTVSPGEVGRGKGSLVDCEAVTRWRLGKNAPALVQRRNDDILRIIETALADTLKRDGSHEQVNMNRGQASGLLALAYQRIWQNVTRKPLHEFVPPPEIEQLCAVYVQWVKAR